MATFKTTKEQLNKYGCADCAKHVIVLVSGTSDAVNAFISGANFATDKHRSNSYDSVAGYWDNDFKSALAQLEKPTDIFGSIALMDEHGWSGDNRILHRKIAGKYLVDRISGVVLGNNGKKYYGPGYVKRPVFFHLVGHSHGGNVINEMTKRIDSMGDLWPEFWKIKSITYLSTPFFTKLHQVKVTPKVFHEDAEILHVHNDYDLTQRMLADFSLETLAEAIHSIDTSVFKEPAKAFENLKITDFYFDKSQMGMEDVDDSWLGVDIQTRTTFVDGKRVYDNYLKVFKAVKDIINASMNIVNELSVPVEFSTNRQDSNHIKEDLQPYSHAIVPKDTAEKVVRVLQSIRDQLDVNITSFETRNQTHVNGRTPYNVLNLLRDLSINTFAGLVSDFFNVDRKSLESTEELGFVNQLVDIFLHNIEKFDNTYVKPDPQFEGTFLSGKITGLNVTSRDVYDKQKPYSDHFKKFITHINRIEDEYSGSPRRSLVDLIFTLAQQSAKIRYISQKVTEKAILMRNLAQLISKYRRSYTWAKQGETERNLFSVASSLQNITDILSDREFGELEPEYTLISDEEKGRLAEKEKKLVPGSIPYLLIESHSVSRRKLHDEVKDFLRRLGPQKK